MQKKICSYVVSKENIAAKRRNSMEQKKSNWLTWVIIAGIVAVVAYSIYLLYWKMYFVGK